jgi:hypothetical protein
METEAHIASYTMHGTGGENAPSSLAEVKNDGAVPTLFHTFSGFDTELIKHCSSLFSHDPC